MYEELKGLLDQSQKWSSPNLKFKLCYFTEFHFWLTKVYESEKKIAIACVVYVRSVIKDHSSALLAWRDGI
jgi:hypothetical protein